VLRDAIRPEALAAAWKHVRRRGAAGIDGIDAANYERDLDRRLERLSARVLAGTWRPGRLLHLRIPKRDGGLRMLGIPTLDDRLLQTAVLRTVTPGVDAVFREGVHGYRPGRSPQTAIAHLVGRSRPRPWLELVKADITSLFDSLPHEAVREAASLVPDPLWGWLVDGWLEAWPTRPGTGVPQGAPLSPLLANLVLHVFVDGGLERLGRPWVRYADDLVLVRSDRSGGLRAVMALEGHLHGCGLRLAGHKVHAVGAGIPCPLTVLGIPLVLAPAPDGFVLVRSEEHRASGMWRSTWPWA
jgi:retron-type reverse transcriptase